jgi:hypothetical protein
MGCTGVVDDHTGAPGALHSPVQCWRPPSLVPVTGLTNGLSVVVIG